MHLVYSLEEPPSRDLPSIFLAGPTPRQYSGVKSWRPRAIRVLKELRFPGIVFIPENRNIRSKINHKEQPRWEHRMLHKASCILFWIPRDIKKLPGFTTNVEYGLFAKSGKVNMGAPKRAEKIGYLRFMANEFSIPQDWDLRSTLKTAIHIATSKQSAGKQEYLYCPFCASRLSLKIEEHKEKKYCHDCNWTYYPAPHIAVAGVIIRNGKILMVRRNREPFKGTWMFPAGFLEFGEHPEETLCRELLEETGLRVTSSSLLRILKSTADPRSPKHLVLFYKIEADGDIVNNDNDENLDVQWKSLHEKVDIGFPHHRIIFDQTLIRFANL